MTEFIHEKIRLWGDLAFTVDGNSKITASDGTYARPVPNAFSLPHISTCPGSTPSCRSSCYVHGLQRHAPEVYRTYMENERALHAVLGSAGESTAARVLGSWIADNCTRFRWHVSGDVFSLAYARWIRSVCASAPAVQFWIYTRSHWLAAGLDKEPNLTVNLSADRDNWLIANATARATGLRLCYMSQNAHDVPPLPPGSVIFPDYPARGRELDDPTAHAWWQARTAAERRMVCPPDFFGQSEQHRCGPCTKCLVK